MNNNRPIIYVGYSNDGGHAWNIDGYEDDYFHNNWGWGGSQNGYYLLSSLYGFVYDQGALINMIPESLENAIDIAEKQADVEVEYVIVGITGHQIRGINNTGVITVNSSGTELINEKEITHLDINMINNLTII